MPRTASQSATVSRQGLDLVALPNIGEHRQCLDSEIARLAGDGFGLIPVAARVDDDVSALGRQFKHGRAPDIASRPGNQRDLALELAHHVLPAVWYQRVRLVIRLMQLNGAAR
jgi:hypothetical protein